MRAALQGGGASASTRRSLVPSVLTLAVPLAGAALLGWAVLSGGGAGDSRLVWIGGGAVLAAALAFAGALPAPRLDAAGAAALLLLAGFVVWNGVSVIWSIEPDRSWEAFNRGAAYVALLLLGALAAPLLTRPAEAAAGAVAAAFLAAVVWALAGKVVPALGPDVERSARLREPVGYWNALALVLAMAIPLWLWLAADRGRSPALRAAASAAVFATVVALALTTSRGGVTVAAVAAAAWLVLAPARLEGAAALLLAVPPGLVVAVWALDRPALVDAGVQSDRSRHGALLGLFLALGIVAVAAAAFLFARAEARRPLSAADRRRLGRLAAGVGAGLVALALVAGAVRAGDPAGWVEARFDEFRNPPAVEVTQDPERLGSFSSNHRWTWWTQAWRLWREQPLDGWGAGTYDLARRPIRADTQAPIEPHNLALQALSETGVVGFLLLAGAVGAAAWAVAGALRRLGGAERAAAAALAAAAVAYLAHALVDIGWEYLAVSAPVFVALGVLLAAGRPPAVRRRLPHRGAAVLLAAAALASLTVPWLAGRRLEDAFDALARGDLAAAERAARQAADLNPLSVEPLLAEAAAAEFAGDLDRAERLYIEAVRLQPRNPSPWFELGRFEFESDADPDAAFVYLDRSYGLDRYGPSGPLLDDVRAALEARGAPG
jgi:hypothetical protein